MLVETQSNKYTPRAIRQPDITYFEMNNVHGYPSTSSSARHLHQETQDQSKPRLSETNLTQVTACIGCLNEANATGVLLP